MRKVQTHFVKLSFSPLRLPERSSSFLRMNSIVFSVTDRGSAVGSVSSGIRGYCGVSVTVAFGM